MPIKSKKVSNNQSNALSKKEFNRLVLNWGRTPLVNVPALFYGFNGNNSQRIVSYQLPQASLKELLSKVNPAELFNIRIYLGAEDLNLHKIEDTPAFLPIIQGIAKGDVSKATSFATEADYNPPLMDTISPSSPFKPTIEIPSDAANLFILGWSSYSNTEMGNAFEGVSGGAFQRVRAFTFDGQDSNAIYAFLTANSNAQLYVHLGILPIPSSEFPFQFHPVLEVYNPGGSTKYDAEFFEYSSPCPPACEPPKN